MVLLGQFKTQVRFNLLKKPMFVLRAIAHLFKNIFFKDKSFLRTMVVMINSECNCKCQHCLTQSFAKDYRGLKPLSTSEMCSALSEMADNGVFHFSLQGGEPFIDSHLDGLIKACKPYKSYISLVTNGTVAAKEELKRVYHMGVDKIAISLDSYYPLEHDLFRGLKGCHEKALKTLGMAREIGLDVAIAVTVTNDTLFKDGIQKLLDWAINNKIIVEINVPQPVGNWDGREDLILTDDHFKYINNLYLKHPNIRRDLYPNFGRSGCPAVKESLYMSIYGDIYPCVFMHISIGNIREHSLENIRKNALSVYEFGEYAPKCLAGEDKGFIRKYVSQGFGKPKPADGFKIFNLKKPQKRLSQCSVF